jgi:hypothetical protein
MLFSGQARFSTRPLASAPPRFLGLTAPFQVSCAADWGFSLRRKISSDRKKIGPSNGLRSLLDRSSGCAGCRQQALANEVGFPAPWAGVGDGCTKQAKKPRANSWRASSWSARLPFGADGFCFVARRRAEEWMADRCFVTLAPLSLTLGTSRKCADYMSMDRRASTRPLREMHGRSRTRRTLLETTEMESTRPACLLMTKPRAHPGETLGRNNTSHTLGNARLKFEGRHRGEARSGSAHLIVPEARKLSAGGALRGASAISNSPFAAAAVSSSGR